jgi:protein-tyrosine kinase
MTVDAPHSGFVGLATRLRHVLLETGQLTHEDAQRVEDVMRNRELGFDEAAIELGLITPEDLAAATLLAAQPLAPGRDEFIRRANHGFSTTRNLPVKYVGIVKAGPSLNLIRDPDNAYSEQIRALRTELVLNNGGTDRGSSIAVLSACQNEGRTQLCAELAIAFAQLGKRTLLVDADLRRPP